MTVGLGTITPVVGKLLSVAIFETVHSVMLAIYIQRDLFGG